MGSVGLLILFAVVGALICAKAHSAAGAITFAVLAVVLLVTTPVGDGLPDAVSSFMSAFDDAATPALNREPDTGR
ncbi:hypothetical protein H7X46_11505 [Pseudonocardia sp. C8]|uniref:hypothetical protein n=1 Tax=Pseudonocardia sp. C8 TaxID=2762759 RepID=UPI001642DE01|nr:hypothetical protein [Pseudonocardia sp. C8]MBC3191687.1 hypothetical protein [Pseudonocardia sp. C8]